MSPDENQVRVPSDDPEVTEVISRTNATLIELTPLPTAQRGVDVLHQILLSEAARLCPNRRLSFVIKPNPHTRSADIEVWEDKGETGI